MLLFILVFAYDYSYFAILWWPFGDFLIGVSQVQSARWWFLQPSQKYVPSTGTHVFPQGAWKVHHQLLVLWFGMAYKGSSTISGFTGSTIKRIRFYFKRPWEVVEQKSGK